MDVVLVQPQIATNTGNIIRLCANVGAALHLVRPLGFVLDDASLRRAGLDYHELTDTTVHDTLDEVLVSCGVHSARNGRPTAYALTAGTHRAYTDVDFDIDDVIVFGTERHGLSPDSLARFDDAHRLHIPMRPDNRSLNLANAVAIVAYEIWRQHHFAGAAADGTTSESIR